MLDTLRPLENTALFRAFAAGVPVCLALACLTWQVPQRAGGSVLLHTFLVSCVSAALRLGSLGHRQAQALLLSLRPRLSSLVNMVWERELEELGAFAPLADIRAMQHAYLPVRLFSS